MNTIDEILQFNRTFVKNEEYKQYETTKYPDKKLAIVSCMDTRLTELLPASLGSVIRSLLVAVFELDVNTIMVIGHSNCGAQHMNAEEMCRHMINSGVTQDHIDLMHYCGIDFEKWLAGFENGEMSVKETVNTIKHHPLMPKSLDVRGFIIDSTTGELTPIQCD